MRILLIGPTGDGGSIPPYLTVLTQALRDLGAHVDRLGCPRLPYDTRTRTFWNADRILATATALLDTVDLGHYDLLSVHFGNLEIEQLLPTLWVNRARRPPAVHHIHSLDWTLFTQHVPDPELRAAVDDGVRAMDGMIAFGDYGRTQLIRRYQITTPTTVAWLPTTIPPATTPTSPASLTALLQQTTTPVGSCYGYAAPWKDPTSLVTACRTATQPCRIIVAGPLWDEPHHTGLDLTATTPTSRHQPTQMTLVPEYLPAPARKALVTCSDFAIFPYQHQPTFQGSGAIADYLAHGIPILATYVANMTELVGPAGIIVNPGAPAALATALDRLAGDAHQRHQLAQHALKRAYRFTAAHHAACCLRFYDTIIHSTRTRSRP
jgi:glycosyltransferase involved in cell wall biosynthesis